MSYACILLPFPPTTNNLFAGKKRRFPSPAYKAWQKAARCALVRQFCHSHIARKARAA